MDGILRRPMATPPWSVPHSAPRYIVAAARTDASKAILAARHAGCGPDHSGPCTVARSAMAKATRLFGGIAPAQPKDELVALSCRCAAPRDCRCPDTECLPLAHIRAAKIVTRKGATR
jgi:hypothetical protein